MGSTFKDKLGNVGLMEAERGYDVTIVCTSDEQQALYWQQRLDRAKGLVIPSKSVAIAVDEDWKGGAGNFLGTLYAWRKACARHAELTGEDLAARLRAGASVALFHTAGKGTRLAPMPGAENNNKPGVKLPSPGTPSILECVIRQTGAYAASRKGRLSVFWGDQIFVPSASIEYVPRHHVDIACALGPMPSAEEWAQQGLQNYGCIVANAEGSVLAMLEKVSHAEAAAQTASLEGVERVGFSLGSFSVSSAFLGALDGAFATELADKAGKMDTDPHVWMAMTLDCKAYAALMVAKGLFDDSGAMAHHQRVTALISKFSATAGADLPGGMFGAVNVGLDCSWWDYGQLKLYARNSLLLTEDSEDARLARAFFHILEHRRVEGDCALGGCEVDAASVVSATRAKTGKVTASALAGVTAGEVCADGAVLVNVCAKRIIAAKGAVAYNVVDKSEDGIILGENEVRVGVFTLDSDRPYFEMRSSQGIDGGKVFKEKVCENAFSFQEVYDLNHGVDVTACAAAAAKAYEERSQALSL